jgi:hypothetical protein
MYVEGPGDGADRLPVSDEFPGQFLLVWPHFLWPSEGDAARFGGQSAVACSAYDEGAFELSDAGEDRHDHPPGRACRVGLWLIK